MELKPHQQRVVEEKSDLDEKIAKLKDFTNNNPVFATLPEDEQARLTRQYDIMLAYSAVLGERIAAFSS